MYAIGSVLSGSHTRSDPLTLLYGLDVKDFDTVFTHLPGK